MNLSLPALFDILIGLTFIYLILSLLASEIQELIAAFLQFRAKHLKKSIYIMLGGTKNSRDIELSLRGLTSVEPPIYTKSDDSHKAINLTNKLYENSLIASLSQSRLGFSRADELTKHLYGPSYISSDTFASALFDILEGELKVSAEDIVDKITSSFKPANTIQIETIPKKLREQLYELAIRTELKAESTNQKELKSYQFKKEIEKWYNRSQNRTSGTYKRNTKFLLFLIGLITAVFANANAFHIVSTLYHQATVRNIITQAAVTAVADCKPTGTDNQDCLKTLDTTIEQTLKSDQLPLGWKFSSPSPTPSPTASPSNSPTPTPTPSPTGTSLKDVGINFSFIKLRNKVIHLLGWIVSAFAIMMGAPFWFDLLNKFVNVRNAGPRPASSPKSSSSTES